MAWSVTTLAWGLIEFKSGYETAGEYNEAVDQIMWVTDYFVKCHTAPNEFWGQVGDGNTGPVSNFIPGKMFSIRHNSLNLIDD